MSRLSDLLERIHDTPGIERIKFITNFPKDMTDDLLDAVRDLPKVCPYLHVPAQSGCNEVLKRMKRLYTVEFYRDMLARCRENGAGRVDQQRFHRRLQRRNGGIVRAHLRSGPRRPGSRTATSSSTAPAPAPRATSCSQTTFPRSRRNAATTTCWPCKTPPA